MAKAQEGRDIQAMTDGQMFEELIKICLLYTSDAADE